MAENLKFNLTHLTGARFVASFWIVCGHFVPRSVHSTALNNVRVWPRLFLAEIYS